MKTEEIPYDEQTMRQTIALLHTEHGSCVVRNGTSVRVFRERGVKDLGGCCMKNPTCSAELS